MVKKLVLSLLIAASVITVVPIEASAEWKNDDTGWFYKEGSSYYTGWKQIDGAWYYFARDFYMRTGWVQDGPSWYYLQNNGVMATGKVPIDGKIYEFDSSGKWINSNGTDSTPGPLQDKLKAAPNLSWVTYEGNAYFKTINTGVLTGAWIIDGYKYMFNKNGVMQKNEYTLKDGTKYLFGNDGKYIKCLTNDKFELIVGGPIITKSTSDNNVVKLDDSHMMDITGTFSKASSQSVGNAQGIKVDGKTLYCKVMKGVELGAIKVIGTDVNSSSMPKLMINSDCSDKDVAFSGVSTSLEDGFLKEIKLTVYANKVGKSTVTLNVNGTVTSFDVVVTE